MQPGPLSGHGKAPIPSGLRQHLRLVSAGFSLGGSADALARNVLLRVYFGLAVFHRIFLFLSCLPPSSSSDVRSFSLHEIANPVARNPFDAGNGIREGVVAYDSAGLVT